MRLDNQNNSIILKVSVKCRSGKDELVEITNEKLKVKLRAAPEHGRGNESLISLLSREIKLNKENIKILSGKQYKEKIIKLENINKKHLAEKLLKFRKEKT